LHRLLDELSWEGNAKKYRGGGHRLENVLTTEVFGMLDLLPRPWFLARVIRAAHGADEAREAAAADADVAAVEVLHGDLQPTWLSGNPTGWRIQPDILLDAPSSLTYVEAKAARGGRFSAVQVSRCLQTTLHGAGDRSPLLLLVLGSPPPLPVVGHGRLGLSEALECGLDAVPPVDAERLRLAADVTIAWITWQQIASAVEGGLSELPALNPMVRAGIDRTAQRLRTAIQAAVQA
jgi:hypothetical protein